MEKYNDAIRSCEAWLEASRPAEREQPEWLEVAFQLAVAQQAKLKQLPEKSGSRRRLESQIRELLRTVAALPNEFQSDARLDLASLSRGGAGAEFKTFADALAGGKAALELMNSTLMAAKVARENNPEAVGELEREAAASKDDAGRAFEAALDLADRQTVVADLNGARYYLAWIYWDQDRIDEAAVLGEFLASRYPESEFGPGAAKIALASWEKQYQHAHAEGGAGGFAASKLAAMAQLMATRWPDAPESASAVNILINVALRDDRVDEAQELLAKLPEGSRAAAELSLGSALWNQYLQMTSGRELEFDAKVNALREQAGTLLASGFAGIRERGQPTTSAAVGALYLVQLLLARGDWQGALDALEDKNVGPLTLVEAKADAASRPDFVLETYKAALRAYLTAEPPDRTKAKAMMEALDKFVASQGGAAADQLTRVYVGLGVQLQRQLKELTAAGNHVKAQQVAAAFGDVLDRVAARPDAGDWAVRNWIAQTNLQLGQGLEGEQAKKYLTRARDAYEAVLAAAIKGGPDAPDDAEVLGVHKRLGECLVALGDYKGGVDQFAELLAKRPNALDVQVAAANALQTWGGTARVQAALDQAVHGAKPQPGGKNVIWGWVKLGQTADSARARATAQAATDPAKAKDAKLFEDLFFEARFNVAKVRYLSGTIAQGSARKPHFEVARQLIAQMKSLYPALGGPKWKAAFESLLNQVNAELQKQ